MLRTLLLAPMALAPAALLASPPPASPLVGTWVERDGPGMAMIGPCASTPGRLCATGLQRQPGGKTVQTGPVMSDIRADGANRWRGSYHHGKRKLPATLRLTAEREVKMRVCMMVICQSATYVRN